MSACLLVIIELVGLEYARGYALEFGSVDFPRPHHLALIATYGLLGTLAVLSLAHGCSVLLRGTATANAIGKVFHLGSNRGWIIGAACGAFLLPVFVRTWVLHSMPLTDDEGTYVFSSRLLLEGRLWVQSPPEKVFFDRQFMLNDGRWFTQYFLGWPALLAPWLATGLEAFANPIYSALTVPPLCAVARRISGNAGLRLAALLYVLSPLVFVVSATLLSHTSCWMLLCWSGWCVMRVHDARASSSTHALFGLLLSAAFFVRPLPAAAFGLPLVTLWGLATPRGSTHKYRALAAFGSPVLALSCVWLYVNWELTGSPFKTAYDAVFEYHRSQGFQFATYTRAILDQGGVLQTNRISKGFAVAGAALLRLNLALFGWPSALALPLLAWTSPRAPALWAIIGTFFAAHLLSPSVGVDIVGPVHYIELTPVFVLLTCIGVTRWKVAWLRRVPRSDRPGVRVFVGSTLLACFVLAAALYYPARLGALSNSSKRLAAVFTAPEHIRPKRAVIFVPHPMWMKCNAAPTSVVLFRPANDPTLSDDVLWVNHLSLERDRAFLEKHYPDREGLFLMWSDECQPNLIPLHMLKTRRRTL